MKIAFLMRSDFMLKRGGDVVQVESYCRELERMGHQCKLFDTLTQDTCFEYDNFVLVNIDRPVETVDYWKIIKKTVPNKKIFLIPIHHPIVAINQFEKMQRGLGYRLLNLIFPDFYVREKIKNLVRFRKNLRLFVTSIKHLTISYRCTVADILKKIDGIIFISNGERISVERDFGVNSLRYVVAHNAVELGKKPVFIPPESRAYDVIVVGRIEPRKNQLSVVQALKKTAYKVCFVGAANINSDNYVEIFQNKIDENKNFEYLGVKSHEETLNVVANSRMLLNASFFEVNPLVDLEAALVGTEVVTTKNSYSLESLPSALLVDPWNLEDILEKVQSVLESKTDTLKNAKVSESWIDPTMKIENMMLLNDDYSSLEKN